MSQDRPERPPTANFLAALDVKRNATIGLAAGVAGSAAVFGFFVVPNWSAIDSPALYLALAFVLATALAGVVALALTVRSAVKLSREVDAEDDRVPAGDRSG